MPARPWSDRQGKSGPGYAVSAWTIPPVTASYHTDMHPSTRCCHHLFAALAARVHSGSICDVPVIILQGNAAKPMPGRWSTRARAGEGGWAKATSPPPGGSHIAGRGPGLPLEAGGGLSSKPASLLDSPRWSPRPDKALSPSPMMSRLAGTYQNSRCPDGLGAYRRVERRASREGPVRDASSHLRWTQHDRG